MGLVAAKIVAPIDESDINDGGESVSSTPFYPAIKLADIRRSMRLNGGVTTERLKHMATNAVSYVNDKLNVWQQKQENSGYSSLALVPSTLLNGESRHVFLYRHAIFSFTKAYLIENYRDIDTTRDGEKHAQALSTQVDDLHRDGQNALRDLLGVPRMIAELA